MPVDTRSKRISALRKTVLFPDGTIAASDRPHITWNYTGITVTPIVPPTLLYLAENDSLTKSRGTGDLIKSYGANDSLRG